MTLRQQDADLLTTLVAQQSQGGNNVFATIGSALNSELGNKLNMPVGQIRADAPQSPVPDVDEAPRGCDQGTYLSGGSCVQCPKGRFLTAVESALTTTTECNECPDGQYQTEEGQAGCVECDGRICFFDKAGENRVRLELASQTDQACQKQKPSKA